MSFKKSYIIALSFAAFVGISSCGSLNEESPSAGIGQMIKARFAGRDEVVAPPQPVLTRAAADANPGAYRLMSLVGQPEQAALVPAGTNGARITWISADQVSITLENGLLVATRGFAEDLMAADVSSVIEALISSGGTVPRRMEYLDGLDQITTQVLQCSIASGGLETLNILDLDVATERFDEVCSSNSLTFTNVYWISDAGSIVKSQQLISRGVGFLQIITP